MLVKTSVQSQLRPVITDFKNVKANRQVAAHAAMQERRDMTADIMEGVIKIAVGTRLHKYKHIGARVSCDSLGVLGGRFGSMQIQGRGWHTPLKMTAEELVVDVGELAVDYGALVWQRKLSLKNQPIGTCSLVLTSTDLGNFMMHPLMAQVSNRAVQGRPFFFDKNTVLVNSHEGFVEFEGVAAVDSQRYRLHMTTLAGRGLAVTAELVARGSQGDDTELSVMEEEVAEGIRRMFTNINLDLQGVELTLPTLTILPGDLLQIQMRIRIRELPPLSMQF